MPVKLGDGQTIWADCVDLNQKDTNNTMVMEFDNNLNNSNDLAPDQNNSVMNQQNRPIQQHTVSKNLKKKFFFNWERSTVCPTKAKINILRIFIPYRAGS